MTLRSRCVTGDMAEAVRGAELILCPAPATAQADIAKALAPHLVDGQVVFLPPATFGSMLFAKAARDAGNRADVAFAETGTLPWLTRKHGPFEVAITVRAKRLPTGVFPLTRKDHALAVISKAFPGVIEDCGDALSGALMNAGPDHPSAAHHHECRPAGAFRPLGHPQGGDASLDPPRHRRARCRAHRGAPRRSATAPRIFRLADHYAKEGEEWMYGRGSHDRLTDSGDWREHIVLTTHRYMLEDTRIGLSFLVSVAELAGVATPLARAFAAIGGAICGEDFMATGRTLKSLGFGHLDRAGLQLLLREGFR